MLALGARFKIGTVCAGDLWSRLECPTTSGRCVTAPASPLIHRVGPAFLVVTCAPHDKNSTALLCLIMADQWK